MPIGVLSFFLSFFCSYFGVAIGCHDQFPSSGFFRQPAKTPSKNLPKLVPGTACAFYKEPAGDRKSHTIDELPGTVWPALALGPKRKRAKLDPATFVCHECGKSGHIKRNCPQFREVQAAEAAAEKAAADAAGARQTAGTIDMGDGVEPEPAPAPKPGGKAPATSAFASAFAAAPAPAPAAAAEPATPTPAKKRWRSGGSRPKPVGTGGAKKKSKRR